MTTDTLTPVNVDNITYPKYTSEEVCILCDKLTYKPKYDNDAGRDTVRNFAILMWIAMAIFCFLVFKCPVEFTFFIFATGLVVALTMLESLTLIDRLRAKRMHQIWSKSDECGYRALLLLKTNMSIIEDFIATVQEYEALKEDYKIMWDGNGLQLISYEGANVKVVHCACSGISVDTDGDGKIKMLSMEKYNERVEEFLYYGNLKREDIQPAGDREVTVFMPHVFNGKFGVKCDRCGNINLVDAKVDHIMCERCERILMSFNVCKKGTFQNKMDKLLDSIRDKVTT